MNIINGWMAPLCCLALTALLPADEAVTVKPEAALRRVGTDVSISFASIAAAIKVARPGDRIILMPMRYRESIDFTNRSGGIEKPIVIEGNGAIIDGSDVVDLRAWEDRGGGLYRKAAWKAPLLSNKDVMARYFMIFDGVIQRMGRCSKGLSKQVPLKEPGALLDNEWTYRAEEDALYVKIRPGTVIEMPVRSSGVIVAGQCSDLEFNGLTMTHVYNDGINIHGRCERVTLRNVRCCECGDDGVSVHDDCAVSVFGLVSERNATGITDTGSSVTRYDGVEIKDIVGIDLYFLGPGTHEVRNGSIRSRAAIPLRLEGKSGEATCRLRLQNTTLTREAGEGMVRLSGNCALEMQGCNLVGLSLLATSGMVEAWDCRFSGSPPPTFILRSPSTWRGDRNVFALTAITHDKISYTAEKLPAFREKFNSDHNSQWR